MPPLLLPTHAFPDSYPCFPYHSHPLVHIPFLILQQCVCVYECVCMVKKKIPQRYIQQKSSILKLLGKAVLEREGIAKLYHK